VKKNNIDLGRFDPIFFEHDALYGDKSLYGLPYTVPFGALYYNKDIFDRMAVDYPKDGMTWDETIELGRRLSRTLDGVAYKGLVVDLNRVTTSTGQSYIDPVTFKATIANNEGFRKALSTYQRIISIPGNDWTGSIVNNFLDGKAAMLAFIQMFDKNLEKATNNGLKWDISQFPSYDKPKSTYLSYVPILLIPTKTSKHKDAALTVVDVLTSEEMQKFVSAQGQLTSLKNPEILKVFGNDVPYLKGKSVQSIFKSRPAPPRVITEYENLVSPILFSKGADQLKKGVDVNTVLREADEQLNQAIEAARSK
jgi:multiple sugar transport system substrate-binding protein